MTGRREQILDVAAELFAQRGYHGVSIAELGEACGVTGPALYKHFRGKQAILAEMLVAISDELLDEGRRRVKDNDDPRLALRALVDWHVEFALAHRPLIVVQDRDWSNLPVESRERVRETQRRYIAVWVETLRAVRPELEQRRARAMVQAAFGLINSTRRSARLPDEQMREILVPMAYAALTCAQHSY